MTRVRVVCCEGSAAPAAPVNDVKLEEVSSGKLQSVPMVDIRVLNVSMRIKDAIEVMANQMGVTDPAYQAQNAGSRIKDLGIRIDGLAIQSNKNGVITISALRDEGMLCLPSRKRTTCSMLSPRAVMWRIYGYSRVKV